ncbi:ATP-binding protein [Dolichospermum sp. UHCC 0684]|jgi:signal transduction histidine kinase|uniref:ATP-binding response regulator n=1 Tax=unclassified Dolichospermum TaxID=2622029 RepID=UPI001447788C|nr:MULTISPECIES: ATP-binding protein [unclassified Dolichospermum]MEA5531822.1 ATP-binding protein [Dolichospermum sp. UHCC 0684]MTJ35130.1 hypothetical protein [Dolichospermum sp. UHCC 0260]
MKILLVEDDQRIAKPLAEDLKHQRYVVDIAKDGIEGWEYSQSTLNYTSIQGTIEITNRRLGSHLYVSVKDIGVGIALDNLEKVFDRFWRADESRTYNCGGSGLGLAIAQAIAKKHGGLITVKSELGIGSCFTVRLLSTSK